MARKLVSGAAFPRNYRGRTVRLAQITTNGRTHYFSTEPVTYDGNTYQDWLVMDAPLRRFRSLRVDSASLKLQNADGQLEALVFAQEFEGAEVRVLELLDDLTPTKDALELVRGVLADRAANQQFIEWSIVPAWDPVTVAAPGRVFSRTCTFRFKAPECGYRDGVSPHDPATGQPYLACPKDFAACQARGRRHRFPGFIHITRKLEQVYPSRPTVHPTPPENRWDLQGRFTVP